MLESSFQKEVIFDLENIFPGCVVLKLDPTYTQGIPDLLVLYKDRWAILECKRSSKEKKQANQDYYIKLLNDMSSASFIYPENKKDVLDEIQRTFKKPRTARIP